MPTPVTITDEPRVATYSPVASAGPFPVPFPVFDASGADLRVLLNAEPISGWSFSGDLAAGFYGAPNTWVNGSVTLPASVTGSVRIEGRRAPRRTSQFGEGRGIPARDANHELNVLTAVQRELYDRLNISDAALSARVDRELGLFAAALANVIAGNIGYAPTVYPESFGAKNDGETNDGPAIQTALNFVRALPNGGRVSFRAGGGYASDNELDCYPSRRITLEWEPGAVLLSRLIGVEKVLLKGSHPSLPGPSNRGQGLTLINPYIRFHDDAHDDPNPGGVFFEFRYASDLKILGGGGLMLHYKGNTAIRVSALFNCDMDQISIWGAGPAIRRHITDDVLFSIALGGTTLTSSVPHFVADDYGRTIFVNNEILTVQDINSASSVTVTKASRRADTVNKPGVWGAPKVSTAAGYSIVQSDTFLTTADIGRVVYIQAAGIEVDGGRDLHRCTITGVSGNTFTVSPPPVATVDLVDLIISPAVEIFGEAEEPTNDMDWRGLHLEQIWGSGLVVTDAYNCRFSSLKLHGQNEVYDQHATHHLGVFSNVGGYMGWAEFEGQVVNPNGRIELYAPTVMTFEGWTGIGVEHQRLVYLGSPRNHSYVVIGDVHMDNSVTQATVDEALFIAEPRGLMARRGVINAAYGGQALGPTDEFVPYPY